MPYYRSLVENAPFHLSDLPMKNRRETNLKLVFFVLLVLIQGGCSWAASKSSATPPPPTLPPDQQTQRADPLSGSAWLLVSYGPPGSETGAVTAAPATLEFGRGGLIRGNGGCNSFSGQYQLQGKKVTFSNFTSSMMACVDQTLTDQETAVLKGLQSAGTFAISADQLVIFSTSGGSQLIFSRTSAAPWQ